MTDLALWPFALEFYGRPGAEAALLALQDQHGQCVPLLIWSLWLGETGRPVAAATLDSGAALARAWQESAIEPLRGLRRRLKSPVKAANPTAAERLRLGVKTLELDAERMLLEMLESASPAPDGAAQSPASCLAAAVQAWGCEAPAESLAELAALAG